MDFLKPAPVASSVGHRSGVNIVHVKNPSNTYLFKHPAGGYGGENCIVIDDEYTVFDPEIADTSHLSLLQVGRMMLHAYNERPDADDLARTTHCISMPISLHPIFGIPYALVTALTFIYANDTKDVAKLDQAQAISAEIKAMQFDFDRFKVWVAERHARVKVNPLRYLPMNDEQLSKHDFSALLSVIPKENLTMSFQSFKTQSCLQKQLKDDATEFCRRVLDGEPAALIYTGQPGIGKTATATIIAKELAARGRKIAWVSEEMLKRSNATASTMDDLDSLTNKLLEGNLDVVVLDDNNMTPGTGERLLAAIYRWYIEHTNKAICRPRVSLQWSRAMEQK